MWFAGNHSDVGGSYPESETRLSDISLGWMAHAFQTFPDRKEPDGFAGSERFELCVEFFQWHFSVKNQWRPTARPTSRSCRTSSRANRRASSSQRSITSA
ncbi:hypothetical protein CK489_39740 [Bradyrhizobium sp. UFLA03-84]|nr:hypothetical protein CK489_39740 [Bradyrhizobium sp. UFLA03-84]